MLKVRYYFILKRVYCLDLYKAAIVPFESWISFEFSGGDTTTHFV